MGSTASQTATFGKLLKQACANPREGNYKGIRDVIVEMRASGATYNHINVPLTEDSAMGQMFAARWAAEQVNYPELPPVQWQGRKREDGMSSKQAMRSRAVSRRDEAGIDLSHASEDDLDIADDLLDLCID